MDMSKQVVRIPAQELGAFIARCLVAAGLPEGDVEIVGGLMSDADLNGSDGHGVFRLPQYVERIRAGGINPTPDIKFVRETAAMAVPPI